MADGLARLSLAVLAQAFLDLADNEPKQWKRVDDERQLHQHTARAFLSGDGALHTFGLSWWCDNLGLDAEYVKALVTRIDADPALAAEIRHRLSYLGSLERRSSPGDAVGAVEDEAEETISEEERDARWHSTILTYISKKGIAAPTP